MKNNRYYINIITGTTLGLLIILGALMFKVQDGRIEALKDELYLKKQNKQRASDYYESSLNIKTIQSEFNTLQEYAIQKGNKINMNQ